MAMATNLGFPRIGPDRELKKAVEGYWSGDVSYEQLLETGKQLRQQNWQLQREAGIDQPPSNDFSYYDQVLDTVALVGAVPSRYGWHGDRVDMETYFQMARGKIEKETQTDVIAMEMTKWFDTNYHYIVPEFERDQSFKVATDKPVDEFKEALDQGVKTRPVLLGPITFLLLGKTREEGLNKLSLLDNLLPVYGEILRKLADAGADWVQMDEPALVLDLDDETKAAYEKAYKQLKEAAPGIKLLLTTYFYGVRENLSVAQKLPVDGVHVDLKREPGQLDDVLEALPESMVLSAGVVDGRNIWKNDMEASLETLQKIEKKVGSERLWVAPSCSMLHVPIDLDLEEDLDAEIADWLSFAKQKLGEIGTLTKGVNEGKKAIQSALDENKRAMDSRKKSEKVNLPDTQKRVKKLRPEDAQRASAFEDRKPEQTKALQLPLMPTTTIGSFPQTAEIRKQRAAYRRSEIDENAYEQFLKKEIEQTIRAQEEVGLDVLVHGEPERTDMVEYFGEQLTGLTFTRKAWVQSYGSRCVRPPVIYGDVSRPAPMTVGWSTYSQSLTDKPVKGMLTGPITILQWSFVRDDQPRSETARQIALAIRDEVVDLEKAGIKAIQIDEPATREGLPLRRADWDQYLDWAVECFRLASSGVQDQTQIHTHMCYAEFNDIIGAIEKMDADVISIEASRSQMELLEAFAERGYPNDIGPGVYDIHSPRIPSAEEMQEQLEKALKHLSPDQVWVNPDCGLKTRKWDEVKAALTNMVQSARHERARLQGEPVGA